jgi:hypothetical protein
MSDVRRLEHVGDLDLDNLMPFGQRVMQSFDHVRVPREQIEGALAGVVEHPVEPDPRGRVPAVRRPSDDGGPSRI